MKFSIRKRFLFAYGIFLFIQIAVTLISSANTNGAYKSDTTAHDNQFKVVYYTQEVQKDLCYIQGALQKAVINMDDNEQVNNQVDSIKIYESNLKKQLDNADKLVDISEERQILECNKDKWIYYNNYYEDNVIKYIKLHNLEEVKAGLKESENLLGDLNNSLQNFISFSAIEFNKLDSYNTDKTKYSNKIFILSAILFLVLALIISYVLERSVVKPINMLIDAADNLAVGNFRTYTNIKREDEIGKLVDSFNSMAGRLRKKEQFRERTLEIIKVLASSATLKDLLNNSLKMLMDASNCQIGTVYLRQDESDVFELAESFGLQNDADFKSEFRLGEGLIGSAAMNEKPQILTNIPEETHFAIESVGGKFIPKTILNIPLYINGEVIGIFSMASIYSVESHQIDIIEASKTQLAIAISNAIANMKTENIAEKLKANNEELQAQSEQLIDAAEQIENQRIELEKADRLKSEFLSNMSHELRTPLNSILGLSQLVISRRSDKIPSNELEYIKIIERNGRHLLNLINDILDLSKIESGRMDINIEQAEPEKIVEWTIEMVKEMSEEKGLYIEAHIEEVPLMYSDTAKIRQIMLNLISNAIKFTQKGGIDVDVKFNGENILFAVKDTGIGINLKDQENIFKKFRQADGSIARKHEGTGLGLTISRRLARLLGGDVILESSLGEGSTFTLVLPINFFNYDTSIKKVMDENIQDSLIDEEEPEEPKTILVIDDVKYICEILKSYLEEVGYNVLVAHNGIDGIRMVNENKVDLITVDIFLPEMDGEEIVRLLREKEVTKDLPVIVISASDNNSSFKELGVSAFITKPVDKSALQEEVFKIFGRKFIKKSEDIGSTEEVDKVNEVSSSPILVVEDNEDNMFTITELLKDMNLRFIKAYDGLSGIELARELKPSMILMDIQLPGLSGLEAAKKIKADSEMASIPIIALTAKVMKGDSTEILAAGCNDYLPKPIEYDELKTKIHKWLKKT